MKYLVPMIMSVSWLTVGSALAAETEIMVLGTYHFANPGADTHNMIADDVLQSKRQKELESLALALGDFKPTKIMVEEEGKAPAFVSQEFSRFKETQLEKDRNETAQVAFRLAMKLGHKTVYAIDEQPAKGEPDYYPIDKVEKYVKAHGLESVRKVQLEHGAAIMRSVEEKQKTASIPELLLFYNDRKNTDWRMGWYYPMLAFSDGNDQPGAELNAAWYLRNAKIFSKLMHVAKPGDRILIVYGNGHRYWLQHFVEETPGMKLIDATPFLQKAAGALK